MDKETRINIQYSTTVEDLPDEIRRLFQCVSDEMDSLCEAVESPEDVLSMLTIQKVHSLKRHMYNIQFKLNDIESIVAAYLRYATEPPAAPVQDEVST
jgi:phage host-nuclease inhibitor protein Gam